MSSLRELKKDLRNFASKKREIGQARYFKTKKGEYAFGDKFLGVATPDLKKVFIKHKSISESDIELLINSEYHEERTLALMFLIDRFQKGNETEKTRIFKYYLKKTAKINNWDLVDISASKIVGEYLKTRPKNIIYSLANSNSLWEKRIAVISTFSFIKDANYTDAFAIAEKLLGDPNDLIHKAIGWLLREIGKKDRLSQLSFLKKNYTDIPRTTLRYAIEKYPEPERKRILKGIF